MGGVLKQQVLDDENLMSILTFCKDVYYQIICGPKNDM